MWKPTQTENIVRFIDKFYYLSVYKLLYYKYINIRMKENKAMDRYISHENKWKHIDYIKKINKWEEDRNFMKKIVYILWDIWIWLKQW